MAVWPPSLPQAPRLEGFSESGDGVVLRSNMDAGPPKLRPVYSKEVVRVPVSMTMDDTQVATFVTFWRTTLVMGSLSFEWEDFIEGGTVDVYFASRPTYTKLSADLTRVEFLVEHMK